MNLNQLIGKRVLYNGYNQYTYKKTKFIIWNGEAYSKIPDWYIAIIESPYNFSERDLDHVTWTKKMALEYAIYLIDREHKNKNE